MNYVVFDLELNQDFSSLQKPKSTFVPFEIIQIGAVKLDSEFNTIGTFNRYVKPSVYAEINPFITELTGITTEQLQSEETFPEVYKAYTGFIGGTETIFCTWGLSDIKELFRNAEKFQSDTGLLPRTYINIQPYVSLYFKLPAKNLLRLQHAVEALDISMKETFHNAYNDAYYTAEIFKRIYNSFIQPIVYDPSGIVVKPRQPKRVIDTVGLINQFEKMYSRELTEEEKGMILLAYKMGKTHQFLN